MLYYVNAQASRDGNGSKEMPFRHIDDAARVAVAGDEIPSPLVYTVRRSLPATQAARMRASSIAPKYPLPR